jgi:hypothetical protein
MLTLLHDHGRLPLGTRRQSYPKPLNHASGGPSSGMARGYPVAAPPVLRQANIPRATYHHRPTTINGELL